jgi:hypothetical protein
MPRLNGFHFGWSVGSSDVKTVQTPFLCVKYSEDLGY